MKLRKIKRLRGDIKHDAVITAAKKVFMKQGFRATSMDEVAREAGVSKRTVYDHFGDKEKLFETMLSDHWNTLLKLDTPLFVETESITINLKHFAKVFIKFLYQQDTIDLFRLLIGEANQFPDLVNTIVIEEKAPFTRALINFLQQKKISGELTIENSERSASYFMGLLKEYHFWPMMLGFTKQKKMSAKNKLINETVDIFIKIYTKK